jgi:FkbM family methyltransferase
MRTLWRRNASGHAGYVDRMCDHTYVPAVLNSNSIVVDLGANQGDFSHELIRRHGCQVYAAEPLASLCALIQPSPRLKLYPVAIGGRNGFATLNVFASRCASLLGGKPDETTLQAQEVEVVDLHSLLALIAVEHVDLMKVDVEGAELDMFESALPTDLMRIGQLSVEFHDFIYPERAPRVEAIKRWLQSIGFWMINFSLDNTDVLFINPASGISLFDYRKLRYIAKYVEGGRRRLRRLGKHRRGSVPVVTRSGA